MEFKDFGFGEALLDALYYMGFEKATPIQEQAIPIILNGKDILASAQTGTGKTSTNRSKDFLTQLTYLLSLYMEVVLDKNGRCKAEHSKKESM